MLQRGILFHSVLSGRKMLGTRQILIYRSPIRSISSFLRDISKVFRGILDCIDWIDFSPSFFFFFSFQTTTILPFLFLSNTFNLILRYQWLKREILFKNIGWSVEQFLNMHQKYIINCTKKKEEEKNDSFSPE